MAVYWLQIRTSVAPQVMLWPQHFTLLPGFFYPLPQKAWQLLKNKDIINGHSLCKLFQWKRWLVSRLLRSKRCHYSKSVASSLGQTSHSNHHCSKTWIQVINYRKSSMQTQSCFVKTLTDGRWPNGWAVLTSCHVHCQRHRRQVSLPNTKQKTNKLFKNRWISHTSLC